MMSFLSDSFSTVRAFSKPRYAVVLVLVLFFFAVALMLDFSSGNSRFSESGDGVYSGRNLSTLFATHRKLLKHSAIAMEQPNRMWGEKCTTGDIVVNQGPTAPLPNGIPTYTVEIMNVCVTGCDISGIHLNCGWFSSARLINPKVFKRLRYNDCLVNDGKPLVNGGSLSFEYANTFLYPLSVASVTC